MPSMRTLLPLLLLAVTSGANIPILGSASDALTRAVAEALPREALVIFVQEGEVYLDVTKEKGAAVGQKYAIERPGEEIRHPETGNLLGRSSTRVGEVEITWIQEGFSRAKILSQPEGGIRVKDAARLAAPPVIARLPLRHDDGSYSRLTESVDAEIAAALAAISGIEVRVGPATNAALSVAGRIVGEKILLTVMKPATSSVVAEISARIPDECLSLGAEKIAAPIRSSGPSSMERIEYHETGEVSSVLSFVPVEMTAGDVDGDGIDEIIFAEDKSIRIGKLKLDGTFDEIAKLSIGWSAQIFRVDAGDIDGDGKAEIYVTEKPGNYVRTSGYRFDSGKLNRFFRESGMFLRVARLPDGDALYGQRYGSSRPFERGVMRYRFNGGKLSGGAAGVPSAVTVFDFVPLGTSGYTASIDYENKLRLYNQAGDGVWRSAEQYGGSDIRIESADKRNAAEQRIGIEALDVDGDRVPEVVVVQNLLEGGIIPGFVRIGNLQGYKNGRIVALALDGASLTERWKTKSWAGVIKGFSVANPLGRGPEAVFFSFEKVSIWEERATLRSVPLN